MLEMAVFENVPLSCRTVKREKEEVHFLPLSANLIRNRDQGPGCLSGWKPLLSARSNLEGGLTSLAEGSEHSGRPCARVLSVPGFLAIMSRKLAGRRFILGVKKALPPCAEASLFQHPD